MGRAGAGQYVTAAHAVAAPESVPVRTPCRCEGGRLRPLRVRLAPARQLVTLLRSIPHDFLNATYLELRCPKCHAIVPVTVADLLA